MKKIIGNILILTMLGAMTACSSKSVENHSEQLMNQPSENDGRENLKWDSACDFDGTLSEQGVLNGITYEINPSGYYNGEYSARCYVLNKADDGKYYYTICSGEHSTGGYGIKIVDMIANEQNEWVVIVEETSPSYEEFVTEAFTYPTCVLSLSSEPYMIIFENTDGVEFPLASGISNADTIDGESS